MSRLDIKRLEKQIVRQDWDEYFFEIARIVSSRSVCLRRKVGTVIVKDKCVISTGYNGPPMGCKHCNETGCLRERRNVPTGERIELCRGSHSEINAIVLAANKGISLMGAKLYTQWLPCGMCMKAIINSGIQEVHYRKDYPDTLGKELAGEAGLRLIKHGEM